MLAMAKKQIPGSFKSSSSSSCTTVMTTATTTGTKTTQMATAEETKPEKLFCHPWIRSKGLHAKHSSPHDTMHFVICQ